MTFPRVRRAVTTLRPYVPGKSIEDVQREAGIADLIKLNQNENPLGPSPRAIEAAAQALTGAHLYPEGTSRALRTKLASMWDLPEQWFLVGNGSDEVFRLLAETYLEPGARVVVPVPSFAGYPLVAELMDSEVIRVPLADWTMNLSAMAKAAVEGPASLVFLCRPNGPTGGVFSEEALHAFMPLVPSGTLVVLDEAYREYDETSFGSRDLLLAYPNLILTHTFSKIYGMAGLRLGYGIMRPEIVAPLFSVRDPFSVNSIALAAGMAALDDHDHLERSRTMNREGKQFLYSVFDRLGVSYVPTQANFILFDTGRPAGDVYNGILREGVLVRPCVSFGLPTSLRVTIGTRTQNERFARALQSVISRQP